jgi:hypothetical protein
MTRHREHLPAVIQSICHSEIESSGVLDTLKEGFQRNVKVALLVAELYGSDLSVPVISPTFNSILQPSLTLTGFLQIFPML